MDMDMIWYRIWIWIYGWYVELLSPCASQKKGNRPWEVFLAYSGGYPYTNDMDQEAKTLLSF